MSSMNHTLTRKRPRFPDYRESDSEEELRPFKLRKKHGSKVPVIITNKVRDLLSWFSDLNVSEYFAMAIRHGSKLPHETIIIDDDDDEEDDEDEIQEVKKVACFEKLTPYIQNLENPQKSNGNECRHSRRLLEKNGSCSLKTSYGFPKTTNGSYDWNSRYRGNGSYNLRQSHTDSLKRPAIISNPGTDIEVLLGTEPKAAVQEPDEIEILTELPCSKHKSNSGSAATRRLCTRSSVARNSISSLGQVQKPKVSVVKSQSTPYTATEVVRLQEKFQYKLLLEKYTNSPCYHPIAKKPQSDAEVQADSSTFFSNHFKKEVLQQPVESFIQKYYKPCQLLLSDKAKESDEKEPCEIKIDDEDETDDDIQILDIKLPEPKRRHPNMSLTKFLTPEWLSQLKVDVSSRAEERLRIDETYQKEIERLRKERLLNRLRVEPQSTQAYEPEFPELTAEMEEAVDQAWCAGAPDEMVCKNLMRKDMETLSGLSWLNDLVINSYFDLIAERSKQEGYPSSYCFNTYFYTSLKLKGFSSVRRWTRKIDIFSYDLNFVPLHLGLHWCLAVIDHRSKKVSYYDSMGSEEECSIDLLHDYLMSEYKDKKGQILDPGAYIKEVVKGIPQQMNGSDCGMFTVKYAEYISRDAEITFTQGHMQYFRRRMAYELLTSQLL